MLHGRDLYPIRVSPNLQPGGGRKETAKKKTEKREKKKKRKEGNVTYHRPHAGGGRPGSVDRDRHTIRVREQDLAA